MAWYHKLRNPEEYIFSFLKWMVLSAILGLVGGLIGTGFHKMLDLATEIRMEHTVLIWALPLAGLPIIGLYHLCHLEKSRGTNDVIDAFNDKKDVSPFLAPLIFIATTITHLFGGSAGREGAALQIGGTLGSILGRIFRLSKEDRSVMIVSGMSAVFAALFGTPITACLFSLEFVSVGTIFDPGLLPCLTASFAASQVALLFGVAPTAFDLPYVLQITPANTLRILIFAVLIALLSTFFCYTMHKTEHLFKRLLPNAYIRIVAGGIIVL
ncbi:MAG: chloride channel protein, partial [Clostridia bacterium]|nr:chloride channel protein [Clostridia bacterium]